MTSHQDPPTPQVPALQAVWPPDRGKLYLLLVDEHWKLEAFAHEVLRGRADRQQLDEEAARLEMLAGLLRKHEPDA